MARFCPLRVVRTVQARAGAHCAAAVTRDSATTAAAAAFWFIIIFWFKRAADSDVSPGPGRWAGAGTGPGQRPWRTAGGPVDS